MVSCNTLKILTFNKICSCSMDDCVTKFYKLNFFFFNKNKSVYIFCTCIKIKLLKIKSYIKIGYKSVKNCINLLKTVLKIQYNSLIKPHKTRLEG